MSAHVGVKSANAHTTKLIVVASRKMASSTNRFRRANSVAKSVLGELGTADRALQLV
jgi:hypothetical protein